MESRTWLDFGVEFFAEFIVAEFEARLDERGVLFDGELGVGFDVAEDPAFAFGDDLDRGILPWRAAYPHSRNAPSVNFWILPLCTSVTDLRPYSSAYSMARRTRRLVPVMEMGLMPMPESVRIFFLPPLSMSSLRKLDELLGFGCAFAELDAGVDVFGVLAKDDDVELLGMLHRAGHARVVLHRADAGVEVEDLAQGDVERADAAADRRGQRSFDGDAEIAGRVDGVIGEPGFELAEGLFAGVDFEPLYGALAAVRLLDCGVEDPLRGAPDVASGAVAFDKRDDGMVGDGEFSIGILDRLAAGGQRQSVIARLHVGGSLQLDKVG